LYPFNRSTHAAHTDRIALLSFLLRLTLSFRSSHPSRSFVLPLQATITRMSERKRRKEALGDRKSAAAQGRMKSIAELASEGPSAAKKRKRGGDGECLCSSSLFLWSFGSFRKRRCDSS
jgi:hypothetical protein